MRNEEVRQAQEEYDRYIQENLRKAAMKRLSDEEREAILQVSVPAIHTHMGLWGSGEDTPGGGGRVGGGVHSGLLLSDCFGSGISCMLGLAVADHTAELASEREPKLTQRDPSDFQL